MTPVSSAKFVKLLKKFAPDELQAFDRWLNSPWCNTNKNLIRLFEKVKKHYPDFDHPKLTKEKLFKQVLPNGKFSEKRINNLLSEAYLSAEQFMVFQNLKKKKTLQKELLTEELQDRDLETWFFQEADKEIERLEAKTPKDWEEHLDLLRLHRRIYHHPNQNPRMKPGGQTIIKMGEQLELAYLLEKAATINEKIFRNRILRDENHDIKPELEKWHIVSKNIKHPAIELYKMRFDYTEENMLQQYFKLKKAFMNSYEELNKKELKIHLLSLLNDSAKLRKARALSPSHQLSLFKLGLKTKALLTSGKLAIKTYVSIVSTSNTQGDFDFSNGFIDNYSDALDLNAKDDAIYWGKANTAYYTKKHEKALDLLRNHEFKINYFQNISRLLNTQIYFDLFLKNDSYEDYLFNYFDTYEKWLLREKKGSKFLKKSYLRFVQVCRSLAKHYLQVEFNPQKVKCLLEEETNIQAPRWIEKKISEVLKQKKRHTI